MTLMDADKRPRVYIDVSLHEKSRPRFTTSECSAPATALSGLEEKHGGWFNYVRPPPPMRMTLHEIMLVATIATVLLAGALIKHYRDAYRASHPTATGTAATPKPKPARPPYVTMKK
jgi:hypothetical protein